MTREEIMEMTGKELCDWLWRKGILSVLDDTQRIYFRDSHKDNNWNLPACMVAARDYIVKMDREKHPGIALEWFNTMPTMPVWESPEWWLRATVLAIVIAEKETSHAES